MRGPKSPRLENMIGLIDWFTWVAIPSVRIPPNAFLLLFFIIMGIGFYSFPSSII